MVQIANAPTPKSAKEHWTQTPQGKIRLATLGRKARLTRKRNARKFPTRESRIALVEEWRRSGLSARLFAPKHGLKDADLYSWQSLTKKREAREDHGNNATAIVRAGRAESTEQEQEQIDTDIQYQNQICNAVGECRGFLRVYAESIGVPSRVFTKRVGELLFRSSHG